MSIRLPKIKYLLFALTLINAACVLSQSSTTVHERQLIHSIKIEKSETQKFLKMLKLGEYYKTHNVYRADSMKHVLLQKSRVFNDSIRFSALMFSAEVNEIQGNSDEYFRDILGCQPFLNKLYSDEVTYKIYRHLGYYHSSSLEFETAAFYLSIAQKLATKKRSNARIAETNNYIALNFMFQNNKDSAIYYSNRALHFARRNSNKKILFESFNNQARIYDYFGQVELSVSKNLIALQLATEMNDIYHMAKFNRELGKSQRLILNLDDATYYFKRSYEFASLISDEHQMGLALTNLGTVYYERKEYKKAIESTNRAIRILSKQDDLNGLGEAHNSLGMIYREKKDYVLAANNLNQALVFYESAGNKEKIAGIYHNVGTVFLKQKKYQNALNYLNRSIEIRKEFGSQNQIYNTYRVIADVYADLGKSTDAVKYMQLYINYMDSNSTIQAATKIAELSELYRSDQRDRLISSQADSIANQRQEKVLTSTKLENSQLRNNFQLYVFFGFLIIVALAGIIGFYRWNQTKIKQQQKEAEMSQTLLRTQMNPHFIFNAMSVIQSYIYDNDTVNSSKFLVNFSRLMRLILENSPKEFIPISTEIEILQKYLETQKLRFEFRFDYTIEVDEEINEELALIPPMITQPFIENSIEHGQLHTIEGGVILIVFKKVGDMFQITITDNGIGRKNSSERKKSSAHKSMAMDITRDRIENINNKYNTNGNLIVEDLDKSLKTGTKVLISLPYKEEISKPQEK